MALVDQLTLTWDPFSANDAKDQLFQAVVSWFISQDSQLLVLDEPGSTMHAVRQTGERIYTVNPRYARAVSPAADLAEVMPGRLRFTLIEVLNLDKDVAKRFTPKNEDRRGKVVYLLADAPDGGVQEITRQSFDFESQFRTYVYCSHARMKAAYCDAYIGIPDSSRQGPSIAERSYVQLFANVTNFVFSEQLWHVAERIVVEVPLAGYPFVESRSARSRLIDSYAVASIARLRVPVYAGRG